MYNKVAMLVPPDQFVVMPSRIHLLILASGVLLGFAGGVFMLFQSNPALVGCGLLAAPVCGVALFDLVRRMIVPRSALVINAQGIYDNSSAFAAGMIYWHEIAEIVAGQQLGFVLTDHNIFLARQPWARRQMLRFFMVVISEAHIAIPPGLLTVSTDELIRVMLTYHDAYEHAST